MGGKSSFRLKRDWFFFGNHVCTQIRTQPFRLSCWYARWLDFSPSPILKIGNRRWRVGGTIFSEVKQHEPTHLTLKPISLGDRNYATNHKTNWHLSLKVECMCKGMCMHNTMIFLRHQLYTSQLVWKTVVWKRVGKSKKLNFLMRRN